MSAANSYGGWVSESHRATGDAYQLISDRPATGGKSSIVRMVGALVVAWCALSPLSGTGDVVSRERVARSAHHAPYGGWSFDADKARGPSEDLARIRDVLNPAVSDLALALGVSRQSVYNWLNGAPVAQDNAGKLKDLADAADVLAQEGVAVNSALLKRKFASGRTLLQVVQAGESAADAARQLSVIYKREMAQREMMNANFASRTRKPSSADFDLPTASESV